MDSIAACPAGDSLVLGGHVGHGHPSRLRIEVWYADASCTPKQGVPPDSIWVTYSTIEGNLLVNDKGTNVYADDSTDACGHTWITISSFSGCGKLRLALNVSGIGQGTKDVVVRTTDMNADGRATFGDVVFGAICDVNYDGVMGGPDLSQVLAHPDHWRRHALHGTLVKRTSHCDNCGGNGLNTVSGEGRIAWQPSGRRIAYAIHDPVIPSRCNLYLVPSDPAGGNAPRKFTFRSDSSDYDPSWSPLGHEIVFYRADRVIYRKGVAGFSADTSDIGVHVEPAGSFVFATTVSPDGDSVAFSRGSAPVELHTIPIVGGTPRQITTGATDANPWWSPDGKILVFTRTPADGGRSDLYKVSTQNAAATDGVLFFQSLNPDQNAGSPAYAPDSQVVVFGLGPIDSPRKTAVVETAAPLSTIKAITSNYPTYLHLGVQPTLSPDGTRLALLAWNPAVPGANAPQVFAARRNMSLPPQFTTIGAHAVADSSTTVSDAPTVGQNFSFTVTAADPEGDALSYDAYFMREGMTFSRPTRTFSWTPPPSAVGKTFNVVFVVTTTSGGTDVVIDKLTVQPCCQSPLAKAVPTGEASDERWDPTAGRLSLATPPVPGVGAELAVFDLSGRRVALVRGPSGSRLLWDGHSEGLRAPSGVYLYRLRVGDHEQRGRVVVLR